MASAPRQIAIDVRKVPRGTGNPGAIPVRAQVVLPTELCEEEDSSKLQEKQRIAQSATEPISQTWSTQSATARGPITYVPPLPPAPPSLPPSALEAEVMSAAPASSMKGPSAAAEAAAQESEATNEDEDGNGTGPDEEDGNGGSSGRTSLDDTALATGGGSRSARRSGRAVARTLSNGAKPGRFSRKAQPGKKELIVEDLLVEKRALVEALREALTGFEYFDPKKHDDLWLLRFILSHKGVVEKAAYAARTALEYRAARGIDDITKTVLSMPARSWPFCEEVFQRLLVYSYLPDPDGSVIWICRVKQLDMHGVMDVGFEKYATFMRHVMEWTFQTMDAVTRRTGRITKYVQVYDLRGASMSQANYEFIKLDSQEGKRRQYLYPQLLGASYYCHAPAVIKFSWDHVFKPMFPTSIVEKTDVLDPTSRESDLEKLLKWIAVEDLPTFLGGQLTLWPVPESSEPDRAHARRAAELGASVLAQGGTEIEAALAILKYGNYLETLEESSERETSELESPGANTKP